jgi:hypothetical protein
MIALNPPIAHDHFMAECFDCWLTHILRDLPTNVSVTAAVTHGIGMPRGSDATFSDFCRRLHRRRGLNRLLVRANLDYFHNANLRMGVEDERGPPF